MSYNGFFNILKPPGMSSAAVAGVVKRLTGEKRVGHAGTLDPEAAGVLPVMVGRATRLFDYLTEKEKTYIAECAFGQATDTQDAQGRVIATGEDLPTWAACEEAAQKLTGDIWQRPSVYSALKQGGKPLYARARAGEAVEAPLRQTHITAIRLLGWQPNNGLLLRVDCGRGTYIRTLCHDLGELVGCPAHMRFLLRAKTGAFDIADALCLEEMSQAAAENRLSQLLLPMDAPLAHLPSREVSPAFARQARNGVAIPAGRLLRAEPQDAGVPVRVYDGAEFLGLARRSGDTYGWLAVLQPNAAE